MITRLDQPIRHPRHLRPGWFVVSIVLMLVAVLLPAHGWVPGAAQSTSEAPSVRFAIYEANDSGLEARVKLIDLDGRTRVVVAIRGVDEGEFLPHIHTGSCQEYSGTPTFPLALFPAGERSRTTVDIGYDDLLSGDYLVDIHPVATSVDELFDPATAVVCGQIAVPEPIEPTEPQPTATPDDDVLIVTTPPDAGVGPIPEQYGSTILLAALAMLAASLAWGGIDLRRRAMLSIAQRRLYRLTGRRL